MIASTGSIRTQKQNGLNDVQPLNSSILNHKTSVKETELQRVFRNEVKNYLNINTHISKKHLQFILIKTVLNENTDIGDDECSNILNRKFEFDRQEQEDLYKCCLDENGNFKNIRNIEKIKTLFSDNDIQLRIENKLKEIKGQPEEM
jgi:hypothetical protein